jgi:hypothetical protein
MGGSDEIVDGGGGGRSIPIVGSIVSNSSDEVSKSSELDFSSERTKPWE